MRRDRPNGANRQACTAHAARERATHGVGEARLLPQHMAVVDRECWHRVREQPAPGASDIMSDQAHEDL